jgi:hypothetical protein
MLLAFHCFPRNWEFPPPKAHFPFPITRIHNGAFRKTHMSNISKRQMQKKSYVLEDTGFGVIEGGNIEGATQNSGFGENLISYVLR